MRNIKYTKELLEDAVAKSFSYSNVVRILGLKQAGGTHTYIANTIKKLEHDFFYGFRTHSTKEDINKS